MYDLLNCGPRSQFVVNDEVIVHNCSYGVGAKKLQTILLINGANFTLEETRELLSAYWSLYGGVTRFKEDLKKEWADNGGWIFDAFGVPMAVDDRKVHDIMNTLIQRSGHLMLVCFIHEMTRRRDAGECPHFDWLIPDFHDETLVQCKNKDREAVRDCMNDVMNVWLNEMLSPMHTRLNGDAEFISTFAEAKIDAEGLQEWDELLEDLEASLSL